MATTLSPGDRIAQYEITGQLGAGGMGVVFRATDTELRREVAIKVLPESLAEDAASLLRFEREAQALAALNHFNIAQIFGLVRQAGTSAFVMELIEGPTLADLISEGPQPVEQAIDIAKQIAGALETAHQHGIVHRDLKPANIKLRPDGVVKVLDFGIARVVDADVGRSPDAISTTPDLTEVGKVLGTAAYMSPEQARGFAVDKRADIWAFGALFYELLSGQPAFYGEDSTETVAGILKSEPDWTRLPHLPPQVEAFLRQCLAKNPDNRVHDIADVRLALEGAYRWSQTDLAQRPVSSGTWTIGVLAMLAAAALAVIATMNFMPSVDAEPTSIRRVTFNSGNVGGARFTSDGQIVYAASWDGEPFALFTTRLDSFQSRRLPDIPPADLLAVSDSGIAAISLDRRSGTGWFPTGAMARVDLGGGAPRPPEADGIIAADFGPDGELAALVRSTGLNSNLEFPPGTVIQQTGLAAYPRVSPDGEQLCYAGNYSWIGIAERGEAPRFLVEETPRAATCAFSPDGSEVWFMYAPTRGTHTLLEAVRTDGSGRRVLQAFTGYATLRDVSAEGKVLIAAGTLELSVRVKDAANERERNLAVFDGSRLLFLDASGSTVLIWDNSEGATAGGNLFLRSMASGAPIQIGSGTAIALSPDGKTIAMLAPGPGNVLTLRSTVDAASRTLPLDFSIAYAPTNNYGTHLTPFLYPDFSNDGSRLLLPLTVDASGTARAHVVDVNDGTQYPVTPAGVVGPLILSGDGNSVAGLENGSIMIYDVDTGDARPAAGGPEPGRLVRWSNDAEFVYVMDLLPAGGRLFRRSLVTGERTFLREIIAPDQSAVTRFEPWVSRDGEAYAYSLDRLLTSLYVLEGIH